MPNVAKNTKNTSANKPKNISHGVLKPILSTLISNIYPKTTKGWRSLETNQRLVSYESCSGTCQKEGISCFGSKIREEVTHMTNINQISDMANCEKVHQVENNRPVINKSSTKGLGFSTKKKRISYDESGWVTC